MATGFQRQHLKSLMRWLVQNEPLIHYKQQRPMTLTELTEQELADRFRRGHTVTSDCSETVTALCKWAGLADPNGLGYNGSGFTGTMLSHLRHYSDPQGADPGALVVFGPGNGDHVAMVYTPGANPMLFSHGSESGPKMVRLNVEIRAHKPPTRFLAVAPL